VQHSTMFVMFPSHTFVGRQVESTNQSYSHPCLSISVSESYYNIRYLSWVNSKSYFCGRLV